MLVYPPESRINQYQYERLIEYFDTGDLDISDTINNYLATEPASAHSSQHDPAVTDEYALAGEVFNGDTRPWEPSKEPPPF